MAGGYIMTMPIYQSSLAQRMADFVALKRIAEKKYIQQAKIVCRFDRFLQLQNFKDSALNRDIINQHIATIQHLKINTRHAHLTLLRQFLRYLHLFEPESYVFETIPFRKPKIHRFYIYNDEQIRALMTAAKSLPPNDSIRPHTFHILIGLLYTTGIRIGEALALNIGDIDHQNLFLYVHKGKFEKDRWIPITNSTYIAVQNYLQIRRLPPSVPADTPLFVNSRQQRLTHNNAYKTFRSLLQLSDINEQHPKGRPRIHDLRHTFAVQRLLQWYQDGDDINAKLPILATHMGHVNISETQIYLHSTAEILQQVSQRFHHHFQQHILKIGG